MAASVELTGFVQRSNGMKSSAVEWTLRAGYFTPARQPLSLVYPRPDAETQSFWRHRNYHSDFLYQIPIGFRGGSWPYKYEILSGPAGSEIGAYIVQTNYGVLSWTPGAATGTQAWVIQCTDCEGTSATATFSATLNNGAFVFLQDGYAGTKVGTITQPLEDISDWWGTGVADATYHNKIIVCRAGQYNATLNPAENTGNMRLQESTKTSQLMAFPGEAVEWDMSTAKILDDTGGGSSGLYAAGITFENARNDVLNAHFFWITAATTHCTWWRCTFKNMTHGTEGTDNTGPIFIGATAAIKSYIFIQDNHCENIINGGFNGTYFTVFRASNVLIHNNSAKNCTTGTGINAKGTVANVTIRANQLWDNVTGIQIGLGYGEEADEIPHDHEICWNNAKCPGNVIQFINSNFYAGQTYNTYLYRNTLQGASGTCQYVGAENFETDANILNFGSYANWNESIQTSVVANIKTTAVSSTGELTSALGFATHGWRPY